MRDALRDSGRTIPPQRQTHRRYVRKKPRESAIAKPELPIHRAHILVSTVQMTAFAAIPLSEPLRDDRETDVIVRV